MSILGFGAGHIGQNDLSERDAEQLLNHALDTGITLIDSARGYGMSEERIGRHIGHRRREFVLSTKVGYGILGFTDWTYDCVQAGINEALRIMHTDCIDIVHLHSCPLGTLQNGDVLRALEDSVHEGKMRIAAYSGENDALEWAIDSGHFASVQHSINICDQRVIDGALARSHQKGLGVIAKRPVANAPWQFDECPKGQYTEEYWWRWKTMDLDPHGINWQEFALRFAAFTPSVHSCIVGTRDPEHLAQNARIVEKGPLPVELYDTIRTAFRQHDPGWWTGQV